MTDRLTHALEQLQSQSISFKQLGKVVEWDFTTLGIKLEILENRKIWAAERLIKQMISEADKYTESSASLVEELDSSDLLL